MARRKKSATLALTRNWRMLFICDHVPRTVLDS
jgi:hypothetical protein